MRHRTGQCIVCGTRYRAPARLRGYVARCGRCRGRVILQSVPARRGGARYRKPPVKVVVILCVAATLAVIGVTAGLVSITLAGDPALKRPPEVGAEVSTSDPVFSAGPIDDTAEVRKIRDQTAVFGIETEGGMS